MFWNVRLEVARCLQIDVSKQVWKVSQLDGKLLLSTVGLNVNVEEERGKLKESMDRPPRITHAWTRHNKLVL